MTRVAAAPLPAVLRQDAALASLVALLTLVGSGISLGDDFEVALLHRAWPWLPGPGGLLLLVAGAVPLAFRRVAPVTVFAGCCAASLGYQAIGYNPEPLPLGVLVALYTVAVTRGPLVCSMAGAAYLYALTMLAMLGLMPVSDDQYFTDLVAVIATVTLGYGVALGRARAEVAEQGAATLARDQDQRVQAAREQEQARIAREVHDIVAHDMSVIVAQAAAARRVFAEQPQTAASALESIETLGRDGLDGLRRLMSLLRTDPVTPERSPQPALDRLPPLLDQVRRAGLPVELVVRGRPRPLPATVELNAYRIVQEALTNSLKHAGPTRATVTLDYEGEALRVEVTDEGTGAGAAARGRQPSQGYGLLGMQQRAALLGGQLVVGPEQGKGFRVMVRLPHAGAST
jgi:signal transduction histidine kinase